MHQLVARVDGEVVGEISLWTGSNSRVRHIAGFGMAVRDDWQGKGVGSASLESALDLADNWLAVTRVRLQVYTDNKAGIALYEKFGFEIESVRRRGAFRNGEYVDTHSMVRNRV